MAGDWIPISVDLPGKPEVAMLSRILGKSIDECLGMLIRFWVWCQAHTDDGYLSGMDTAMIAAVSHVPERFVGALEKVGWLEATESGCFIPNFERWFGGAAKRRLLEARKKRLQRSTRSGGNGKNNGCPDSVPNLSRSCPDSVPNLSRSHRDKNGTRGEESRGKDNTSFITHSSENLSMLENDEGGSELLCGEVAARDSPPPSAVPLIGGQCVLNGFDRVSDLVFQCRGKEKTWRIDAYFFAELAAAFDGLEIAAEIRKAHVWLSANPDRKKTAKGMRSFLWRWLAKATDSRSSGVSMQKHHHHNDDIYGVS